MLLLLLCFVSGAGYVLVVVLCVRSLEMAYRGVKVGRDGDPGTLITLFLDDEFIRHLRWRNVEKEKEQRRVAET